MNKVIKVSTSLLDFEKCQQNLCIVDGTEREIRPKDIHEIWDWSNVKAYEFFRSPFFKMGENIINMLSDNEKINELLFFGDEKSVDLRWLWEIYESKILGFGKHEDYEIANRFISGQKIIRFENELETLIMPESKPDWIVYNEYKFYINNHYENITLGNVEKDKDNHFIYRAPKENTTPVDGKLLELTLAPRATFGHGDYRWCAPITINADSVSCIYPSETMDCYESAKHEGCRIALFGKNSDKEILDRYAKREWWPVITVWESYDFVLNKLRQAGWNK